MEKVKYVTYKVLITKEYATRVFDDMITIPENKPYSEIPAFISAYVRTRLENIMLTEEERAEIHNDKKTYEQGLADAWEAARKMCGFEKYGGLSAEAIEKIFGTPFCEKVFRNFDAAEAIAKIKEYENEKKKIKVGDEVYMDFAPNEIGIVTRIYPKGKIYIMWEDGALGRYDILNCKKTGRHFPQVAELFKAMKEGQ